MDLDSVPERVKGHRTTILNRVEYRLTPVPLAREYFITVTVVHIRTERRVVLVKPDDFSKRINFFLTNINPYLDPPKAGEQLSKFIISQLPEMFRSLWLPTHVD